MNKTMTILAVSLVALLGISGPIGTTNAQYSSLEQACEHEDGCAVEADLWHLAERIPEDDYWAGFEEQLANSAYGRVAPVTRDEAYLHGGVEEFWEMATVTDWIVIPKNTTLYVNTAGEPFWVCYRNSVQSEVADSCSHHYTFVFNAYEGWEWTGLGNAYNGFQLKSADGEDLFFNLAYYDGRG